MAKKKVEKKEAKASVKTVKKGFKKYPLIRPTMIGDTLQPVGYEIALNEDGYRFYKQKKII